MLYANSKLYTWTMDILLFSWGSDVPDIADIDILLILFKPVWFGYMCMIQSSPPYLNS